MGFISSMEVFSSKHSFIFLSNVWFSICYNDDLIVKEIIVDDCERYLQKNIVINAIANTLINLF